MQSTVQELMTRLLRPTKVLIASERVEEISQALSAYECYPLAYQSGTKMEWFDLVLMDAHYSNARNVLQEATEYSIPVVVIVDSSCAFDLLKTDNMFLALLPPVTKADIERIFRALKIKARAKEDAAYFVGKQRLQEIGLAQAV